MRSVCFTGHRQINITRELKTRLSTKLELLVHGGVTEFYAGGASFMLVVLSDLTRLPNKRSQN